MVQMEEGNKNRIGFVSTSTKLKNRLQEIQNQVTLSHSHEGSLAVR